MFRPLRRKDKAVSDEAVQNLLKNETRAIVAVNGDDGYPYAFPIDYLYKPELGKIYFHGAKIGHKVDALKQSDKVCFTVYGNEQYEEGEWAPFLHSVIIYGRCRLVDDFELTKEMVRELAYMHYPSKEAADETFDKHIKATQLFEITIEHVCGKRVHEE